MARPSAVEVERRQSLISELMVTGTTGIEEIRDEMALQGWFLDQADTTARALIEKDILSIKLEWQQSRLSNVNELLGRELAKIEKVEKEAWSEYYRSREDAEKFIDKTFNSQGEGPAPTQKIRQVEGRIANPKFLERICWCIERRIKLLGLDHVAVKKAKMTLQHEVDVSKLDDEELKNQLDRLLGSE